MAKTEYSRMIDYGEWLQVFLNEPLSGHCVRKLAEKSMRFLKIDYDLTSDNALYIFLDPFRPDNILSIEQDVFKVINDCNLFSTIEYWPVPPKQIYIAAETRAKIAKAIESILLKKKDLPKQNLQLAQQSIAKEYTIICDYMFLAIFQVKVDVKRILRSISVFPIPWDALFYEFEKISQVPMGQRTLDQIKTYDAIDQTHSFNRIRASYSRLSEYLNLSATGLVKERRFSDFYAKHCLPFDVLASRILMDFLLMGGDKYFGFCEHCDKFFVIQRRGRKKYCSDSCRALASKMRISKHP